MRVVALLGPSAREHHIRQFEMPGVNLFSGNELDPTDRPDAALIFGGDGTVHRYLAGLATKQIPVLVVPVGSGNDFAQSIAIKNVDGALAAWKRFCAHGDNVKAIDLGTILPLDKLGDDNATGPLPWRGESLETMHFVPDGPRRDLPQMGPRIMQSQLRRRTEAEQEVTRTTFFSCIAGTGLDAAVNRRASKQSALVRGHGGYVLALLQILPGFRPPHFTVSLEVEGTWKTRIHESGYLIAAGNGPQYGQGMRITDRARMDDGLFDVCFVRLLNKLRLLRLFRIVYRGGHLGMKEVEYFRASRMRIATDPIMEVFADGEYVCKTPVELAVRPQALRVIAPA